MSENLAIETKNLGRIYKLRGSKKGKRKELIALQDVSLTVRCIWIAGPEWSWQNDPDQNPDHASFPDLGWARVAGADIHREPDLVRPRINMVSGGESSGYRLLTVRENLWMFSQFYGVPSKEANERIEALLEMVGMKDSMHTKSADLSTGLRQKMNIVRRSLVGNVAQAFPTLANFSDMQILAIMLGLSIFFGIVSVQVFKYCGRLARERGLIDHMTNY